MGTASGRRRRLAAAVGMLVSVSVSTGSASAAIAPERALTDVNRMRATAGVQPVSFDPALSLACDSHNRYLSLNPTSGLSAHDEAPGRPGYTPEGAAAGAGSVLVPSGEFLPSEGWGAAPFHRTSVLEPRLAVSGFAATFGSTCMRTKGPGTEDTGRAVPALTTYPWPANGARDIIEVGIGRNQESPDPYDLLPAGVQRAGFMVTVNVNGPWTQGRPSTRLTGVSLTPDGQAPVAATSCDATCPMGTYLDGGFAVIPHQPLARATWFTLRATGTVTAGGADYPMVHTSRFQSEREDPLTDVELTERTVRVQTQSPAPVDVTIRRDGAVVFARSGGPGTFPLALRNGGYEVCVKQADTDRYKAFSQCRTRELRSRYTVTLGRPSIRGNVARFPVRASGFAVGQRVTTYFRIYGGGRGYRRTPFRTRVLRPVQTVTVRIPRYSPKVSFTLRVPSARAKDGALYKRVTFSSLARRPAKRVTGG